MSILRTTILSLGGCVLTAAAVAAQGSAAKPSPHDQRSSVANEPGQPANKLPEQALTHNFSVQSDQRTPSDAQAPAVRTLALNGDHGRTPISDFFERAPMRTLMVMASDRDRSISQPMAGDKPNLVPEQSATKGLMSEFSTRSELPLRAAIPGDRMSGPTK